MDLYNSVYQLVEQNDCVIIPGFGGFVSNYLDAQIDFKNQEFYPPCKKVAFNRELRSNDGLLINHIRNNSGCTWDVAEKHVNDFVSQLNTKLEQNGKLEFDKLGQFIFKENNLIFIPSPTLNIFEESFGLKSFNYPMIGAGVESIKIQKNKELSKTKSAKLNKKTKKNKPVFFYSGAAAIIIGLLFVAIQFDLIRIENEPQQQEANIIPSNTTISSNNDITTDVETDTDSNETDNITVIEEDVKNVEPVENSKEDEDALVETTSETTFKEQASIQSGNVHVIGGAFVEEINAINYQKELSSKGFDSQVLLANNGMYRVTVKTFANEESAFKELKELRNLSGNQSLWVLNLGY